MADKYSGQSFKIGLGHDAPPDRILVKSYGDVLDEYRVHPEPKSLGPDGLPCHKGTVGLLSRRPVIDRERVWTGKESNRFEDVAGGLIHDVGEVQATYVDTRCGFWQSCVIPLLNHMSKSKLARATQLSERWVQAVRNGKAQPSPATSRKLTRAAVTWARRVLADSTASQVARRDAERLRRSPIAQAVMEQHKTSSRRRRYNERPES